MEIPSNLNLARVFYDITYYVSFHLLDPGCLPVKAADCSCNILKQTGLYFNEKNKKNPTSWTPTEIRENLSCLSNLFALRK